MWRYVSLLAMVIASPAMGWCDTVQFTIDPANTGIVYTGANTPFIDLFSSGLNGTLLTGQSLSLDLMFSNQVLARLFLNDPGAFGVELIVYTNAGTFPGFAGTTTGFLLDPNGNQFGGIQTAGRADCSCGSFAVGLVSFTSANLQGANVVDISGVNFNTTLPSTGYVVTDAQLRFSLNSAYDSVEFGTAQQLPEPSSLLQLGLGLLGLVGIFRKKLSVCP
jgi:PEP-CTERM motif-containing protein